MEYREETLEELIRTMREMRRQMHPRKPLGQCHPSEFYALTKVQELSREQEDGAGVSVGALTAGLGVSMPAVSKMLRRLESRGLVERRTDSGNRRMVWVELTPEGNRILAEAEEQEQTDIRWVADVLGEEDMRHLIRIFRELSQAQKTCIKEDDRC